MRSGGLWRILDGCIGMEGRHRGGREIGPLEFRDSRWRWSGTSLQE